MYKYFIEYHKSDPSLIPRTVRYSNGTFTWELKLTKLVGFRTQITIKLLVKVYGRKASTNRKFRY